MSDQENNSKRKKDRTESTKREHEPDDSEFRENRLESRKRSRDDRRRDDNYSYKSRKSPDFDRRRTGDRRRDDRNSRRRDENDHGSLRRYWDTGRKEEDKFRNNFDSDEEIEVGERFYGGKGDYRRKEDNDRNSRRKEDETRENKTSEQPQAPPASKKSDEMLTSKTGGAYIPPAKLRRMQAEITDKSGAAYQRIAWEALKKSIHGLINKVNTSNIGIIVTELLKENIIRGRGLLARSIMQAQAASPTFTPVYAALTAALNAKLPTIGELIISRLLNQFKRGYRRNDKALCISSGTFLAHLVNQRISHELLILQILMLLTENVTDDSIEITIAILKECGMRLLETAKRSVEMIFSNLRQILHEGSIDKRVQYMIEVIFQIRKDGFKDHEAIPAELDLVEEEDQSTTLIDFEDKVDSQDILNVFKFDPQYLENEEKYKMISKSILDTDSSESDDGEGGDGEEESSGAESEQDEEANKVVIIDNTETNLTALRRTIYLTIHSSLDFEECAHKLLKMQLKPGQEVELCHMILDCCAENRTYDKFYGLLAGRFCAINRIYVTPYEQIFRDSYDTIYRLDTNKLRNVANFFAHLFFTDSISWEALSCIKLNEEDTNSSGRVFIKILFQKMSEEMTLAKLNERLKDPTLQEAFSGLFPRDNPRNTRFSINFFTTIGLGGLTDDLREHLESRPKPAPIPNDVQTADSTSSSSSSSSSSSESSDSSDSSSDDSSPKRKGKKKLSKRRVSNDKEKKVKRLKDDDRRDKKHTEVKKRKNRNESRDRSDRRNRDSSREKKNRDRKR